MTATLVKSRVAVFYYKLMCFLAVISMERNKLLGGSFGGSGGNE